MEIENAMLVSFDINFIMRDQKQRRNGKASGETRNSVGMARLAEFKHWSSDIAVMDFRPLVAEIFPRVNGTPLYTSFHYHPPIVLKLLKSLKTQNQKSFIHPYFAIPCIIMIIGKRSLLKI